MLVFTMKLYDLVIFGATGCTGKYVVLNLHNYVKKCKLNLKWAIAGRSNEKLTNVKKCCQEKTGDDFEYLDIIIADTSDEQSIINMTNQTNVLINCSGPFKIFGEPIILACLETGTHYVDVSNEHQNMEEMQLKYHHIAKEKNVYIVLSCAFDSAVIDLGITFLENQFNGTLNSVETYLELDIARSATSGSLFTPAVTDTLITSFSTKVIDYTKLYKPLPKLEPKLNPRKLFHKNEVIDSKWFMHLNSLNKPVLLRTQRYFYQNESKRPIQIENYIRTKQFGQLLVMIMLVGILYILSQFSLGRSMLKKVLKKKETDNWIEKPSEYIAFSMTFVGDGWSIGKNFTEKPNKKIITKISATDQAFLYGITADICHLSAITILEEADKMPFSGGVYTTASAFSQTSILEKIKDIMEFEVSTEE